MSDRTIAFARFGLGLVVAFVANVAAGLLTPHAASMLRFDLVFRPLLLVLLLLGFSVLLVGSDRVEENPLAAMGLGADPGWLRNIGYGLLLGSAMIAGGVVIVAIVGRYEPTVHLTPHRAMAAIAVVFVLATGAMAEEVMFRGYPFQRLVDAIGGTGAVAVFSALFAALHLMNPHASVWGFLNTVLVGVLLALAYLRTRRLWMSWGIHFGWNLALGLVLGLPVSGLNEFSVVVKSRAAGHLWLTGGSYGLEASATAALMIVLGILVLLARVKPRPQGRTSSGPGVLMEMEPPQ